MRACLVAVLLAASVTTAAARPGAPRPRSRTPGRVAVPHHAPASQFERVAAEPLTTRLDAALGAAHRQVKPYRALRRELREAASPAEWRAFEQASWAPFPLRERWVGEDREGFLDRGLPGKVVTYLQTEAERAPYRVTIGEDGLLRDAGGQLLDLGAGSLLVADADGTLYARDSREIARRVKNGERPFAHSGFLAGRPAEMSIEAEVKAGRATHAKNRSGHYRPSRAPFMAFLLRLERQKLDLSQLEVSFDPKSFVHARDTSP
jgi:hypothetical protein